MIPITLKQYLLQSGGGIVEEGPASIQIININSVIVSDCYFPLVYEKNNFCYLKNGTGKEIFYTIFYNNRGTIVLVNKQTDKLLRKWKLKKMVLTA